MPLVYSISTHVQDLKNKTIYTVALSMFNINPRSRSEELNYIPLLTLKIFNINLLSRSEEQNYFHGCSQYVQYQPTFKICGIYYTPLLTLSIFSISPCSIIWCTKLFTRLALYIQYQPTFKIWRTKLFPRLLSVCSISTYVQDLRN